MLRNNKNIIGNNIQLLEDLKDYLGFAVAGNFANHLGEAGEADNLQ